MNAVDAVADLANRSSDYMTDPAVNVHGVSSWTTETRRRQWHSQ
jgi:hypothetical protein